MRYRWHSGGLAALLGVAALMLGACGGDDTGSEAGGGGGTETQQSKPAKMTISASGADTYPFMGLLEVAKSKGWFDEENLEIEIYAGEGGGDTLRVVSTGSADLAIAGGTSVVLAAADEAQNLDVIGPWFQVNDFLWLTPKANAKVEGASLGFTSAGSSTELMIKGFQAKMPEAKLKGVAVGGLGDQWAAAKAGRITGAFSLAPYTQQVIAEEKAKVLVSGQELLGDLPADLVAVNKDYAKKNPEALKAFWRVADKAFTYAREQPAEASADLAELIPIDQKYLEEALTEYKKGYDIAVDPEVLKNLSDLMVATKTIDEPIDWNTTMNQEYLPEDAQADLGGS